MTPDEIRTIRKNAGLTQEGLARRLGVTISTVQGWESGYRKPRAPIVMLLEMLRDGSLGEAR